MVDAKKEALNDIRLINFEGTNQYCNTGRSQECFRFLKKHREAIFNALQSKPVDVKIDSEGIAFGKWCWISHTKILGMDEERAPVGKPVEGRTIVEKQYLKFIEDHLNTLPQPPEDK